MKKLFGLGKHKKSPAKGAEGAATTTTAKPKGYEVKDKDLGKLHKASWNGDVGKVRQLCKKDASPLDKENRLVGLTSRVESNCLHGF